MKKITLLIIILLIPLQLNANNNIKIGESIYTYQNAYKIIDNIFDKKWGNDFDKKEKAYINLKRKLKAKKENNKQIQDLIELFEYSIIKTKQKRKDFYSKIQKIKIGESTKGKDIYAYYKGDPNYGYFGIFANIHGGYEYGTYNTANYLLNNLYNKDITGWFIIPTINPDGLEYYLKSDKKYQAYLEGRVNYKNIDLNRNFCTKNFLLKEFKKNGYNIGTGINGCNSEKETKVIINTLKKYKFNKIISLHSQGSIIFLPDNSFDDERIINFGYQISKKLPGYLFETDYLNQDQKQNKIKLYEIDEGGIGEYTGTMETYIYEKYNIPVLLIELKNHGEIEKNIINIIEDIH